MAKRRPMTNERRARLGGLGLVARHGRDHMAAISAKGLTGLDHRIAVEAGIPDGLAPADFAARLRAARRAYYIRLAETRWASRRPVAPAVEADQP